MSEPERTVPERTVPVWSALQRRLHWLVVPLVALQYLLQRPMRAANEAVSSGAAVTFTQFLVSTLHTWGGAAVALVMLWRLVLRRREPVPVAGGRFGTRAARLVEWHHRLLYVALLAMALSGALHYYADLAAAARWHELGKWVLAALVSVHVLAAAVHASRSDDTVLQRMWSGRGGRMP